MKKILILLFLIFLSPASFAIVENRPIALSEALELALKTNPQMKMLKLDVDSAKNNIKIASRWKNPDISTFQNIGPSGKGNPQQIGADYTIELLKRGKRKNSAKFEHRAVCDNEKFQEFNLILEVKKAYIDLLLKKTNLKIIEEQKELSKQLYETTKKEAQKNALLKTDVIQAQIAYNRAVIYSNIAKSAFISSQNAFNSVLNSGDINYDTKEDFLSDDYKKLLTINPKNNNLTFDKIKSAALNNRYDLLGAKEEIKKAQAELKVVKSQLIPDIELQGGYAYQTKGYSDDNVFRSGAYAGVGLTNIPIFYRYQPEIKNAKNEIERSQLKYQDLETDIIRNITDAWEKYTIARNNLNFYNDELLNNSKALLEASISSLDKKEIDITSFIVSKKLYLELMLGYNETLAEYYISYAELLREINVSDVEGAEFL